MFRKSPTCFLILPGTAQLEGVRVLIRSLLESNGIELLTTDTASYRSAVTGDVAGAIESADFVIADITGNNPTALFELGIAYGMGKRLLIISQDAEAAPFDLGGLRVLSYRPDDTEKLQYFLERWLKDAV